MKPPKYTKEELAIIKVWGVPSDREYDTRREVYSADGDIRITGLELAKQRKQIHEKYEQASESNNDLKKAA